VGVDVSAAFTPGPWHALDIGEIVPSDGDGYPLDDTRICFMATPGEAGEVGQQRIDANARLIAAAPELYEALERLVARTLDYVGVTDGTFDQALECDAEMRAVSEEGLRILAKARGEQ